VPPGQVPVEHDHVVVGEQRVLESGGPVEGHVDGQLLLPQAGRDRLGESFVVLDYQYPHRRTSSFPGSVLGQPERDLRTTRQDPGWPPSRTRTRV
jgi:hypothetical protein